MPEEIEDKEESPVTNTSASPEKKKKAAGEKAPKQRGKKNVGTEGETVRVTRNRTKQETAK